MSDEIDLSVERGHLLETTTYDAELNPIRAIVTPRPGFQLNGHPSDCRCPACRPDIPRFTTEHGG